MHQRSCLAIAGNTFAGNTSKDCSRKELNEPNIQLRLLIFIVVR